jgi:hypothetical protein
MPVKTSKQSRCKLVLIHYRLLKIDSTGYSCKLGRAELNLLSQLQRNVEGSWCTPGVEELPGHSIRPNSSALQRLVIFHSSWSSEAEEQVLSNFKLHLVLLHREAPWGRQPSETPKRMNHSSMKGSTALRRNTSCGNV